MGCKSKTTNDPLKRKKVCGKKFVPSDEFIFDNLEENGRLQFFFHSPSSELPIRDVLDEQGKKWKTEPHIEINAENFISCCYQQNNIVPFLKSKEKYLFLFTTCRNKKFYGERFIVGYIVKQGLIDCDCKQLIKQGYIDCVKCVNQHHYAVKGVTKLFRFKDAYPLEKLTENAKKVRIRKVSIPETEKILKYLEGKPCVLEECIQKIEELDRKNETKHKTCLVMRGASCEYRNKCLRQALP